MIYHGLTLMVLDLWVQALDSKEIWSNDPKEVVHTHEAKVHAESNVAGQTENCKEKQFHFGFKT